MRGRTLLVGLLRAHAALSSQEESLACMLGGAGGGEAGVGAAAPSTEGVRLALAARFHLASCLRCYLEAVEPWQVRTLWAQRVGWCVALLSGSDVPSLSATRDSSPLARPLLMLAGLTACPLASAALCCLPQPPLMQMVFWGTPAPGLDPGQVAAQVCCCCCCCS